MKEFNMAKRKNKAMQLNHITYICKAAVEDQCEDAYAFSFKDNYGMISVFDGCGGLGAKKYDACKNHTAAYIAARIASGTVLDWFENHMPCDQNGMYASSKRITGGLKDALDKSFSHIKQELDTDGPRLSGSLIRSFPTTASIVLIDSTRVKELKCTFLWAGDSRGYILDPSGLKQCTMDDLRAAEDAFENLYEDSPLSNMLNGDGRYCIHLQKVRCKGPAIIFTATDGTFGYLPSPMHYEWMLVRTLCESASFEDWRIRLRNEIAAVTGDDSTLVMAVYGWKNFSDLQLAFAERESMLRNLLDHEMTTEALRELWSAYKEGYTVYAEKATEEG